MPYASKAARQAHRKARLAEGWCRNCSERAEIGQVCAGCHAKRIAYRPPSRLTPRKRGRPAVNPHVDFWRFVDKDGVAPSHRPDLGNCWQWTGTHSKYGQYIRVATRPAGAGAHRVAYWLTTGIVPVIIDHLCENRLCVRPSHLEDVGTSQENNRRWRESALRQASNAS